MIDKNEVIQAAEKEFAKEEFDRQVELHKEKLRTRRSFWVRIFPWRLQLIRKDVAPSERKQALVALMDRCEVADVRAAYSAWYDKHYEKAGGK